MNNPMLLDPTRTGLLRRRWEKDIDQGFDELEQRVIYRLVTLDPFGLFPLQEQNPFFPKRMVANAGEWSFLQPEHLAAFSAWLSTELQSTILAGGSRSYIEAGVNKGVDRAFVDVRRSERMLDLPGMAQAQPLYFGNQERLGRVFSNSPTNQTAVELLTSLTDRNMQGMADDLSAKLQREIVSSGIVQGISPKELTRALKKQLGISKTRAKTIARTETVRAHAEGALLAMEYLGVTKIGVMVEWSTAGDGRVCPLCSSLAGIVIPIKQAHGLFPRHPNCRCSPIPANVGEDTSEQKRTRDRIRAAIRRSVKAEGGKTTWRGPHLRLPKKAPKPITG